MGREWPRSQYLVLVGLGGQPLVQGRNFGSQILETLSEHFFLWREEQSHIQSSLPGKMNTGLSHHSRTIAIPELRAIGKVESKVPPGRFHCVPSVRGMVPCLFENWRH